MRGFKIAYAELRAELAEAEAEVARIVAALEALPRRVSATGLKTLKTEKKLIVDTIKMTACQVETRLLRLLADHDRRTDGEGRNAAHAHDSPVGQTTGGSDPERYRVRASSVATASHPRNHLAPRHLRSLGPRLRGDLDENGPTRRRSECPRSALRIVPAEHVAIHLDHAFPSGAGQVAEQAAASQQGKCPLQQAAGTPGRVAEQQVGRFFLRASRRDLTRKDP